MPIYEYRCAKCGEVMEMGRDQHDADLLPECCGQPTERLYGPFSFVMK